MVQTVRHVDPESKIGQQVSLEMLHQIIPRELILQALEQEQSTEERQRRLSIGVIQELYGLRLRHYAVPALMLQAAKQAQLDVDQLSYDHAVHILSLALPRFQRATA